ncbi:MAG TPA: phage tail protein, partial [Phycisphaerae bacterium]|nr:phage tail protein [Phycisphaerae bacterium]
MGQGSNDNAIVSAVRSMLGDQGNYGLTESPDPIAASRRQLEGILGMAQPAPAPAPAMVTLLPVTDPFSDLPPEMLKEEVPEQWPVVGQGEDPASRNDEFTHALATKLLPTETAVEFGKVTADWSTGSYITLSLTDENEVLLDPLTSVNVHLASDGSTVTKGILKDAVLRFTRYQKQDDDGIDGVLVGWRPKCGVVFGKPTGAFSGGVTIDLNMTDLNGVALDPAVASTFHLSVDGATSISTSYTTSDVLRCMYYPEVDDDDVDGVVLGLIHEAVPTGTVLPWGGDMSGSPSAPVTVSGPPTGYLFANGQAISRTTYAALFAVIGTRYGVGDASTTFNVPDTCDKAWRGSVSEDGADETHPGDTGGSATHGGDSFVDEVPPLDPLDPEDNPDNTHFNHTAISSFCVDVNDMAR